MSLKDKYEFVAHRGDGYFATVSQYRSKRTGKNVAIKRLKKASLDNPDHLNRFAKEIEFLKRLQGHDNIIRFITSGQDDKGPYYVMPYASSNLHKFIKHHNNTLTIDQRLRLFDQILSAMKHAHHEHVLHRDLSPSNALIFGSIDEPLVAVADFGLGKDAASLSAFTGSSISNYGQPYYVAPEQRDSLKAATEQSDIYSLGKLLNFILTGKDPDTYHPCAVGSVIRKATDVDPAKRYESIDEMAKAYERVKSLVLAGEDDIEIRTLRGLRDKKDIEWHQFHQLALEARVVDHVYDDFLEPVVYIFREPETIQAYHAVIGHDIASFVSMLIDQMEACFRTMGWPFSATHSFGHLLNRFFQNIDDPTVKLACFNKLWDIGYGMGEWDVQDHVKDILQNCQLPPDVIGDVAAHIVESGIVVDESQFRRARLPTPIRKALELVRNEAERKKTDNA